MMILELILLLCVLGFCFYLFQRFVAPRIGSPFNEIIYFVAGLGAIWFVLELFGFVHSGMFGGLHHRWRF